jgi:hypothetical protein
MQSNRCELIERYFARSIVCDTIRFLWVITLYAEARVQELFTWLICF